MPMERGYGLHEDEVVVTCYMDFHLVVHYFGWVVDVVEKSTHSLILLLTIINALLARLSVFGSDGTLRS